MIPHVLSCRYSLVFFFLTGHYLLTRVAYVFFLWAVIRVSLLFLVICLFPIASSLSPVLLFFFDDTHTLCNSNTIEGLWPSICTSLRLQAKPGPKALSLSFRVIA